MESSVGGVFDSPETVAFLVWITRQHDEALVMLCGFVTDNSTQKVGHLIEEFQRDQVKWNLAHEFHETIEPGSTEESEFIIEGFRQLLGFDRESSLVIRKKLRI